MKLLNLLFAALMVSALALTSCQSEKAANNNDSVEASVTPVKSEVTPLKNSKVEPSFTPAPTGPTTVVKFDEATHDFGTIQDGDKVRHTFLFENTGKEPLIISNAKGSCGCTVPVWPKAPIAPGDSGEITVEYNSKGKSKGGTAEAGKVDQKFVTVTANTEPATTRLTIKATVKPDPNAVKLDPVKKDAK